jgi:IMP dehydrogenase
LGPLAQWLELPAHNRTVLGSSPRRPTIYFTPLAQRSERDSYKAVVLGSIPRGRTTKGEMRLSYYLFRDSLSFDDVLLEPKYSDIESRKEIDLSTQIGTTTAIDLLFPVVSSPMDTVTESEMASAMHRAGGLGIIHRYNTIEAQCEAVTGASAKNVGAAIGVTGDFEERACALFDAGATVLCVDIAHGHHILMKKALHRLKSIFEDAVHIMAGNVATLRAFNDLADWGADSIRVGIGGGSICSTRIMTGHGVPTFQSVLDCSRSDRDAAIIADGGIRTCGDIAKALAAGAEAVMLGSMLSGTDESPGEIFRVDGKPFKTYRGMASKEAQIQWRGHVSSEEGVAYRSPYKGPVTDTLELVKKSLQSSFSYSGVKNMKEFRYNSLFTKITQSGMAESKPHILQK